MATPDFFLDVRRLSSTRLRVFFLRPGTEPRLEAAARPQLPKAIPPRPPALAHVDAGKFVAWSDTPGVFLDG
jgi:hypothetical protein